MPRNMFSVICLWCAFTLIHPIFITIMTPLDNTQTRHGGSLRNTLHWLTNNLVCL